MQKVIEYRILILAVFLLAFLATITATFYFFVSTHQEFSANFADNVLRPKIGNQATIDIEAFFFKLQDSANQIKYNFFRQPKDIYTPIAKDNLPIVDDAKFILKPIPPLTSFPPLPLEGKWSTLDMQDKQVLIAQTFIRPDPQRAYAVTSLVKMNMASLDIGSVAGLYEPGGPQKPGPGKIPLPIQISNSLIAAFNGGFQKKDGAYGMVVGNQTYLPLKKDLATLVIYQNDRPQIIKYEGQNLGPDIEAVRQNGPMLIQDGKIVTSSSDWNMQTWGLTTTNSMYTWRSGLGVTANGNLIYAAGPSLVPQTLAAALKAGGAVNAMQLDINPVWVRFVLFQPLGNGKYQYTSLQQNMVNGGYQYLTGYQKDFLYVYKKSGLVATNQRSALNIANK